MTTMRALFLSLALASAASVDEVVLKNGSSFSGVVREARPIPGHGHVAQRLAPILD